MKRFLLALVLSATAYAAQPTIADEFRDNLEWAAFDLMTVTKACAIHHGNLEAALAGAYNLESVPQIIAHLRICEADRADVAQKISELVAAD